MPVGGARGNTTCIGLLRAVNLAGRNRVAMADLRAFLSDLGMREVRTLLQSGNVVFDSDLGGPEALERLFEAEALARLDLRTDFFVRSAAEWSALVASNPFADEARRDPGHLLLMCLKEPVPRGKVADLREAIVGREVIRVKGRHLWVVYPDGIGRSRLTTALIERKLGTRATGRNWNTVLKLESLAGSR